MSDDTKHGSAIATRLRAEAALADRPDQVRRLENEADAVDRLVEQVEHQSGKLAAILYVPFSAPESGGRMSTPAGPVVWVLLEEVDGDHYELCAIYRNEADAVADIRGNVNRLVEMWDVSDEAGSA